MSNIILWNGNSIDNFPFRTIGLYQIAHSVRKSGYSARVVEFSQTLGTRRLVEITKKLIKDDTVAIGVSTSWWNNSTDFTKGSQTIPYSEPEWVVNARTQLEKEFPHLEWIIGGPAVERSNLQLKWILFKGYAEDTIVSWLDKKFKKFKLRTLFNISDLDHRFQEEDFISPQETLPIELGRGCKFKCKFCNYPLIGKIPGTYLRNMECIKSEILYNYEKFGTTKYYFLDDTVNEDEEKIKNLADIVQSLPFELSWVGYNRADLIYAKPDTARVLLDSGIKAAFFGIESFNKEASKMIGKGWCGIRGKEWLPVLKEKLWDNKVSFFLSFIAGLEPETPEQLHSTVDWCLENKMDDWKFQPLFLYKQTNSSQEWLSEFDKNYNEYGYKIPIDSAPRYWVSDHWNFSKAAKIVEELHARSLNHRRFAGWAMFNASNLNYDLKFLKDKNYGSLNSEEVTQRIISLVDNYYLKIMNSP